jgi:hypothetical protein
LPLQTVHPFTQVVGILLQEAARAALVVGYAKCVAQLCNTRY